MTEAELSILQSIAAYVPDLVVRQAIAAGAVSMTQHEERIDAALLFADVSGFTTMSENLARLGKEGAEELTRVLNAYFTAMIDLVYSYGGQIIKFGGDAITCAFIHDPTSEGTEAGLCHRIASATACALAMQGAMDEFQAVETRGGTFQLQMKIGISAGQLLSLTVGTPEEGLEYVLAGPALDRMSQAEHHATAGEVVVDGQCVERQGMTWDGLGISAGEEREGFWLVDGLSHPIAGRRVGGIEWRSLSEDEIDRAIERLVPYLPPTVYERIIEGQRQFVGEHRRVTSMFVNFAGLDYTQDPEAGEKLQRYFTTMQEIVHRYGGRLNRVTTGDKGNLLHIIFGAPVAYEDNEERAVGCALAMAQRVEELPFITDQRTGIASGYVFAGRVGSERRREYTAMGDIVNLSARLMQAAAPRDILLDQRTARAATDEFVCQDLDPIKVKGKQEPVAVCQAMGSREETKVWGDGRTTTRRTSPIVGRERELALIEDVIERASTGTGQILVINGEAGVGKSRLLEEVIAQARKREMIGLGGDCLSYGSQSPYLPWIDFFNAFFGLKQSEEETVEERLDRIERRMVKADPELKDWVPLMGQLLGLPIPDNALTAALDAQLRKQRTFDITLTLLRHQAQQTPLFLIVFEDVHWIDAISLEMLHHVARNIAGHPILLVVLHRPNIDLPEWRSYPYHNEVELTDLPAEDAVRLIQFKLGLPEVPKPLQRLALRGEERINPFFVEEVVNSLIDRGYLVPRPEGLGYALVGDLSQIEIPDSIQTLVMSRIDRLDESSKLTVKVAAVIGRTFKYRTLLGAYPLAIGAERLHTNLERLSALDLTPLDRPAPEWEYIFKHVTTQEVAYESLLYAHRRNLHHRVASYLEQTHVDSLAEYYELLAHHYYQSGDKEKSWIYLIQAGDEAKEKYANEAAIAHYDRALSLELDDPGTYQVYESMGDVYRLTGQYQKAFESYQAALAHRPPTAAQSADIQRKIAKVWELQGQYEEATHYLAEAQSTLVDDEQTPEMARILNAMGWLTVQKGDFDHALQLCTKGLKISQMLPHDEKGQKVRAELQHTLGSIFLRTGDYDEAAARFQESIEMREEIGDIYGMSRSYNNLAVVYWNQSNYDLTARYLGESLNMHRRIGNTYGIAMTYNNLGVLYYTLGDYDQAITHYEHSREIRQEIGDAQGIADVYNNLGEVHHSLGDHTQALHYLEQAAEMYTKIGNREATFEVDKLLASVNVEMGNVDEALEHCQRALHVAQEIGNREYEGVAHRVLGQIYCLAEKLEISRQHLEQSVDTLSQLGNKLELGRSHYELGLILSSDETEAARSHLQRAAQIFEELGVEGERAKALEALSDLP